MRPVDQIYAYIEHKGITAFEFEQTCGLSNAYLSRQKKGNGVIGSEILVRILKSYPELSIIWVLTGEGNMIIAPSASAQEAVQGGLLKGSVHPQLKPQLQPQQENEGSLWQLHEDFIEYKTAKDELIDLLKQQNAVLNAANADKAKIIALLEQRLNKK